MKKRRLMRTVAAAVYGCKHAGGLRGIRNAEHNGGRHHRCKGRRGERGGYNGRRYSGCRRSAPAVEKNYKHTFDCGGGRRCLSGCDDHLPWGF